MCVCESGWWREGGRRGDGWEAEIVRRGGQGGAGRGGKGMEGEESCRGVTGKNPSLSHPVF